MISHVFSHLEARREAGSVSASAFLGIDFLVGGVWVSQSPDGSTIVSEMVYRCLGERFLMADNTSTILSPLSCSYVIGIMGPDPAQPNRLLMSAFATSGSTLQLESEPVDMGTPPVSWTFLGVSNASTGRVEVRQQIVKQNANQFQTNLALKDPASGTWGAVQSQTYTRQ